ncbi:hypothetical protein Tco_1091888 [Tanacetum coccineum]|uniref:Uncharacterized protein n=1 Tax=Tanacetum coccineum TaxID=301880 RepID=A0ABQ5I8J0_9ASTR
MPYPRFTKAIIQHFMTKHKSISTRKGSPYHTVDDDEMLDRLKFINKGDIYQVYGKPIPDTWITNEIKKSKAYKIKVVQNSKYESDYEDTLEGDEILQVHGERTQGVMKNLMNTKVEFRIDLVHGATSVAKSPYRVFLGTLELQEICRFAKKRKAWSHLKLGWEFEEESCLGTREEWRVKLVRVKSNVPGLSSSSVKDKILATSSETSKVENTPAKMLRDLDQQMEKRVDDVAIIDVYIVKLVAQVKETGSTDEEQYLLAYKDEKPKEILWKSTNEDESDNDDEEESNDDNDNEEEEQDEDPSAGSNQGKKTKKRKFNESESSKKTSTAKESSKGKSLAKTSKSSKSITVEEPVEDLVFEKASYDVEKTIDDKMDIVDVPQVDTDPKLTKKD